MQRAEKISFLEVRVIVFLLFPSTNSRLHDYGLLVYAPSLVKMKITLKFCDKCVFEEFMQF